MTLRSHFTLRVIASGFEPPWSLVPDGPVEDCVVDVQARTADAQQLVDSQLDSSGTPFPLVPIYDVMSYDAPNALSIATAGLVLPKIASLP